MSWVQRAAWAASTPWEGIQGKPSFVDGSSSVSDIGQLTGAGFSAGQVPVWNPTLKKFVYASITGIAGYVAPSSSGSSDLPGLPKKIQFYWDAPSLLPLQSCYEDFPFAGAIPGDPVAVGAPFDLHFCQATCAIISLNVARLNIFNANMTSVDLSIGVWKLQIFQ